MILGTENFTILYDCVPIAERMGLKEGHLSTIFLCTLQRPYKTAGLEPTALIFLCFSTRRTQQLYDQDMVIKKTWKLENLRNWILNWERQNLVLNVYASVRIMVLYRIFVFLNS